MHDLFKNTGVDGDGKRHNWQQCSVCGTAKHGGFYWLGGYKSKTVPPCFEWPVNQPQLIEWQATAKLSDLTKE